MQRILWVGALLLLASHAHAQAISTQNTIAVPADGGAGGADALVWKAECQPGMVVTGIQIMVGGTCHNQCNADGRPLATFNVLCSQLQAGGAATTPGTLK